MDPWGPNVHQRTQLVMIPQGRRGCLIFPTHIPGSGQPTLPAKKRQAGQFRIPTYGCRLCLW